MSWMRRDIFEGPTIVLGRTLPRRTARATAVASGLVALALVGCQSDRGGKQVDYEILSPSKWFATADASSPDDEPSGVSGKSSGDIDVAPVPPSINIGGLAPPPAPAPTAGKSYYGVRRTGSHVSASHRARTATPQLIPVPGSR